MRGEALKGVRRPESRKCLLEKRCSIRISNSSPFQKKKANKKIVCLKLSFCFKPVWVHYIEEVIAACPEAARRYSEEVGLPLHLAAGSHASVEVMRNLLEAFPGAARQPNADGALPIHVAVAAKMTMPVIKMLYQVKPAGA